MKTTVVSPSGSVKYLVTSSLESSGRSCRSLIISARRSENNEGASASEISPSKASPANIVVISALSSFNCADNLVMARSASAASEPRMR